MNARKLLRISVVFTLISIFLIGSQPNVVYAVANLATDIAAHYEWYVYQGDKTDGGDCWSELPKKSTAPAVVAMAIQFASHQEIALPKIRTLMGGSCSSTTSDDQVEAALKHWEVPYSSLTTLDAIKNAIISGHPVLAQLNMGLLSPSEKDMNTAYSSPVDNINLYKNSGNNWLVLKGISADEQWFIAYDPNVYDGQPQYFYEGLLPKGKDRYYRISEVGSALLSGENSFSISSSSAVNNIYGTVTDAGLPVMGATVALSDNNTQYTSVRSDTNGAYAFSSLNPETAVVAAIYVNGPERKIGAIKAANNQSQLLPLQASQNDIVLPEAGEISVTLINVGAFDEPSLCSGTFGISGGEVIFNDYVAFQGLLYKVPETFPKNTNLVFSLTPTDFCAQTTYLSSDPSRALVARVSDTTWIISWEDFTDGDFNDLIVRVDLTPRVAPMLKSPVASTTTSALLPTQTTRDLPVVDYFFDHKYPLEAPPTQDPYPFAVTFSGYDSVESYFPYQPYQSYSGNNGTDFRVASGTAILPAADGTIKYAGSDTAYCPLKQASLTQNVVKVEHANGYTTEYWGLASIDPALHMDDLVVRDSGALLGQSGINPCTGLAGLHFVVRNDAGIAVDPFGWSPQTFSHWFQVEDPWETYQNAKSYVLWDLEGDVQQLIDNNTCNTILSVKEQVSLFIPANASSDPMKVILREVNEMPVLGTEIAITTFIIDGYEIEDQLPVGLNIPMTITVKLPADPNRVYKAPMFYYWDLEQERPNKWMPLISQWDPNTLTISTQQANFGIYAVGEQIWKYTYLPALFNK